MELKQEAPMNTRDKMSGRKAGRVPLMVLALAIISYIMAAAGVAEAKSVPINLTVGKATVISVPVSVKTVSVADPTVADVVAVSPKELEINGKKLGSTSMIVWDMDGNKTFFDLNVSVDLSILKTKIGEIAPGDDVHFQMINNDTLIVTGTVATDYRLQKVRNLLLGFGKDITERDLYILQGGVTKEVRSGGTGPDTGFKFVMLLEVAGAPQVMLQITVASIDRKASSELGINWSYASKNLTVDSAVSSVTGGLTSIGPLLKGTASSGLTTQNINGATFSVVDWQNGAQYLLQALANKGLAKVLATPNLVVRSGESGTFLAGGEVPVPIVTSIGASATPTISVEYKEFGVRLNFKPVVTESGLIRLTIDPAEVSSISNNQASINGVSLPIFNTDRISTSVDLREGQSFVIAGLLNSTWTKDLSKLPVLGDIPILGAFFRTQTMDKKDTELMFFVTPKLIKPMAAGEKVELPGANEPNKQQKEDLRWMPLMPTGRSLDLEKVN
jgi:pilus assembly protein CpaC